ncbi:unnamed protein product [Pedinophyceae sp. YPF-701]|nr:unnamed protein product [Pedinophyceae sp. YPF-701]
MCKARRTVSNVARRALSTASQDYAAGLTDEQVEQYRRDGYVALEGFASREECAGLMRRMGMIVERFDPAEQRSVFSTRKQKSDDYFMRSASGIGYFLEEGALGADGELTVPKDRAINKVGHALHDIDPEFRSFSRSERFQGVLRSLGYAHPTPVQSMYIFKQPGIGGEVVPHQDSTFLWTDPRPSCVGLWLALEDADEGNGCMWFAPGSQEQGVGRRFVRAEGSGGPVTFDRDVPPEYTSADLVPVPVPAGTLVLIHGEVLHMSKENTGTRSRHAYTLHVVEGGEGYTWSPENWLQRDDALPFEPMY